MFKFIHVIEIYVHIFEKEIRIYYKNYDFIKNMYRVWEIV